MKKNTGKSQSNRFLVSLLGGSELSIQAFYEQSRRIASVARAAEQTA